MYRENPRIRPTDIMRESDIFAGKTTGEKNDMTEGNNVAIAQKEIQVDTNAGYI